jgi:hypothetical protein
MNTHMRAGRVADGSGAGSRHVRASGEGNNW